jgi:hypothetical protein
MEEMQDGKTERLEGRNERTKKIKIEDKPELKGRRETTREENNKRGPTSCSKVLVNLIVAQLVKNRKTKE